MSTPDVQGAAYNGLVDATPSLPAESYYDPRHHELEMRRIWYRNWVYVGRSSTVAQARSFCTFELGDQRVLLVRDERGTLQGFHNTCRHRGATLCRESAGTLKSGSIVCPYHAWTYNLQGELLRTSSKSPGAGFDVADYPLYRVRVHEWNGFIFVSLCDQPPLFERLFDQPLGRLDAWNLGALELGHVLTKQVKCNWKIFWENYNECLHCPAVHPQLASLVPIYARGLMEERDDPKWREHAGDADPRYKGGVRAGALTWSLDGQLTGAPLPGLSDEDRRTGYFFMTGLPSLYIVAHPDYVRVVRLRPLGPEETELRAEYLLAPATLRQPGLNLQSIVEFTGRVMSEDAAVCELNQRGVRALPHERGVLMPEEYAIRQLHQWIESELARP